MAVRKRRRAIFVPRVRQLRAECQSGGTQPAHISRIRTSLRARRPALGLRSRTTKGGPFAGHLNAIAVPKLDRSHHISRPW